MRRSPKKYLARFEHDDQMEWVTDLAGMAEKYQVKNIYAEIGSIFALTAVLHPRLAAAVLGILIKGLGEDHVLWGTDSVFYGSPQWQIEALRRIEIPDDMREAKDFSPLGGADSEIKKKIFGRNGARLYGLNPDSAEYRQNDILMNLRELAASSPDKIDAVLTDLLLHAT